MSALTLGLELMHTYQENPTRPCYIYWVVGNVWTGLNQQINAVVHFTTVQSTFYTLETNSWTRVEMLSVNMSSVVAMP